MNSEKNGFDPQSKWLIFYQGRLLLVRDGEESLRLPSTSELRPLGLDLSKGKDLGMKGLELHYTMEVDQETLLPENMRFTSMFYLFTSGRRELFRPAGRAIQIVDWDRTHRFCGQCGAPTVDKSGEFAKACPQCGLSGYPRISPSIIVAVIKDKKLLLARSKHFKDYNYHTVISGFVEPGETLEECVQREVEEETGLKVKNIRYYGSQPWPFPNSLMLGFIAEYDQGEIVVDDEELYEASWYAVEELPFLPMSDSIARGLIDWFIANYS